MRKTFAEILHKRMSEDKNIYFLTADLGFKIFDKIKLDFPDRFYNVGASELSMLGIATGLSLSGKTVVAYSITPFLLFRGAEVIRNYINHEKIRVLLVASGRDDDYSHDGFSHFAGDDREFMLSNFHNIICKWPVDTDELERDMKEMFAINKPFYLNLKR